MIRKLKSGQYRLYSRKKDPKTRRRRNLGTSVRKKRPKLTSGRCNISNIIKRDNSSPFELPAGPFETCEVRKCDD